jgi:Domain of unknown function (DUF4129)
MQITLRHLQVKAGQALAIAGVLLMCSVICCGAATLDDYQRRVSTAADLLEQSRGAFEDESLSEPDQFIAANISRIRHMLPAHETVLLNREHVSVDNSWLHEAFAEFEKQNNWTKRLELLTRASERVHAISDRLKELQSAGAAADKDANKGRLAEILRRPEYITVAPESSAVERLLERFFRWLSKLFPKTKPITPGSSPIVSTIAQILIVGIAVVAIAFLIWRFGPRFFQGRRKKKSKREARIVLGERLEPDQTAADLLAQAEELARKGDLRAAIRKAYIALLCELGDRKIVSLAQHKTNRDYLNSVRDKKSLYQAMYALTHSFEVHWYGFVPVGESEWNEFRNGYQKIVMGDG